MLARNRKHNALKDELGSCLDFKYQQMCSCQFQRQLTVSLQAEPLRKWTVLSGLLGKLLLDDKSLLRRLIEGRRQHLSSLNRLKRVKDGL